MGVMDVLAVGNVGKAIIPVVKVRYICFYFMFLYSLSLVTCPNVGQKRNRNWWGVKTQLSNIKSGIWLLHRATTPTSPLLPDGTSETHRNTKSFSFSPVGWNVQGEFFSAKKSSVCSSQSSPSPHAQCLIVSMDWLVWALNWKDASSLPLTHLTLPFLPSPSLKKRYTSFYCLLIL